MVKLGKDLLAVSPLAPHTPHLLALLAGDLLPCKPKSLSPAVFFAFFRHRQAAGSIKQLLPLADESSRSVTLPALHFWSEGK